MKECIFNFASLSIATQLTQAETIRMNRVPCCTGTMPAVKTWKGKVWVWSEKLKISIRVSTDSKHEIDEQHRSESSKEMLFIRMCSTINNFIFHSVAH